MQLDSKLAYAIGGSIVTLIAVFIFNVIFLSESLVPNPAVSSHGNQVQACPTLPEPEECPVLETAIATSAPTAPQKKKVVVKPKEKTCSDECRLAFVNQLISGKGLDDDENNFSMSASQAKSVAQLLQQSPTKLAELENTLSSLRDQSSRDSILYVFSQFPDEEIESVVHKLSSSENKKDRVDALSLLSSVSKKNDVFQSDIKQIISTENDPDILLKAIKLSQSFNPDTVDSVTQNRLSNLIDNSADARVRSQALITKTKLLQNNNELQGDVQKALRSNSDQFKGAGLQALDRVLSQQKKPLAKSNGSSWKSNNDLRKSVEGIANDPNADPRTRVEALNLIRRHYYNK